MVGLFISPFKISLFVNDIDTSILVGIQLNKRIRLPVINHYIHRLASKVVTGTHPE